MATDSTYAPAAASPAQAEGIDFSALFRSMRSHWRTIGAATFLAGAIGAGGSYLITPTFTARTTFLSPQQQSTAGAALSQLGGLASLAGASLGGLKSPADQYVSLMQSETISRRIVARFDLMHVYDTPMLVDALTGLAAHVHISTNKKDSLITVDVDDHSPQRAADMANAYVEELRKMTSGLALTEAQQRRLFFEKQLEQTRDKLTVAQIALQKSGINGGAIKTEPVAAASAYATVKAQIAAGEVRVEALRRTLNDSAPEIQSQLAAIAELRSQLAGLEAPAQPSGSADYIGAFREFKYEQTLFEILAKQFEVAKLDEARDATVYQVIDPATVPERKSKPRRSVMALGAALFGFVAASAFVHRRRTRSRPI